MLCASSVRVGVCGVCVCSGDLEYIKKKKIAVCVFRSFACAVFLLALKKKKKKLNIERYGSHKIDCSSSSLEAFHRGQRT